MGKRKECWVCEEAKDIPLDPAALKQHQPQPERQEGKHGAGGARTGGENIVFQCFTCSPPKQAGLRVAAARDSLSLPFFWFHM